MMREVMSNKMKMLNSELVEMASLVEKQIYESIKALKNQDTELANQVRKNDDKVDEFQRNIEDKCIRFMATESPLAGDLRGIYTTSKIATDLERMADYAVDICKIVPRIEDRGLSQSISPIWEMVDIINNMIKSSIDAFIKGDEKAAYEIREMDDKVDIIYRSMFSIILKKMSKDETMLNQGTQILFASKYLERIGDHVTNICEWIIFSKKGTYVDLNE